MAKGKNDKAEKGDKPEKSEKPEKAARSAKGKTGTAGKAKDAKAPRPAVAAERTTTRTGSTLPGPPPPATVPEPVVPAARTAPDGATVEVPVAAPVTPPATPTVDRPAPAAPVDRTAAAPSGRSADGSATNGARRSAAPVNATAPTMPTAPAAAAERAPGLVDELTTLAMLPVDVARRVLPERRLPFYLGVGALAVVGVVEWPVVLAAGMAWEALRRRRS